MATITNLPRIVSHVQGIAAEAAPLVEVVSSDDVEVVGIVVLAEEATTPGVPDEVEGEEVIDEVLVNHWTTASVGHAHRIHEMESRLKSLFAGVKIFTCTLVSFFVCFPSRS